MTTLLICSLAICFALSGWVFVALQSVHPTKAHRFLDWVIAGCPLSWPCKSLTNRMGKRLAKMIEPHLEPIVLREEWLVNQRWSNPHSKHQKCLHAQHTKPKAHETVYQPRKVFHPTESFEKTKVGTRKPEPKPFKPSPVQKAAPKPVAVKQAAPAPQPERVSKLDPATAALDNRGLEDMLVLFGAKRPRNVGTAADYRKALLEAVEGAIYKPTKQVKV